MIAFLEGVLIEKQPTHVIIDVQGVGYHINIPLSSYESLDVLDGRLKLLTHLHVREDAMTLFGFASMAERDLFELLIKVSGIGPPMALTILSGIPIVDFRRLIAAEDSKGLTRIKGIGQKLAQRLVLEMKDKVGQISPEDFTPDTASLADPNVLDEASAALVGLGVNPVIARKIVATVMKELGDDAPIEEVIRRSLKGI